MEDVTEAIARYFERERPPGVVSVYLFGSHAEKRSHRESDVDVGVLLDRERYSEARDRFDLRVRLSSELMHALQARDIDLVILNDAPPELGRRIVTEGRRLFCVDPEADRAYVRDIQLRYADIAPFLRRMRRIKLDYLVR